MKYLLKFLYQLMLLFKQSFFLFGKVLAFLLALSGVTMLLTKIYLIGALLVVIAAIVLVFRLNYEKIMAKITEGINARSLPKQ
jgi:hypothetical protein